MMLDISIDAKLMAVSGKTCDDNLSSGQLVKTCDQLFVSMYGGTFMSQMWLITAATKSHGQHLSFSQDGSYLAVYAGGIKDFQKILIIRSIDGQIMKAFTYTSMAFSVDYSIRAIVLGKSLSTIGNYKLLGHIAQNGAGSLLYNFQIDLTPQIPVTTKYAMMSKDQSGTQKAYGTSLSKDYKRLYIFENQMKKYYVSSYDAENGAQLWSANFDPAKTLDINKVIWTLSDHITVDVKDVVISIMSDSSNKLYISKFEADITTSVCTSMSILLVSDGNLIKDKFLSALYIESPTSLVLLIHKVSDNQMAMVRANINAMQVYQFIEFLKQENGFLMLGRFFSSQIFYAVNPDKSVTLITTNYASGKYAFPGGKTHGNIFTSDMGLSCTQELRQYVNTKPITADTQADATITFQTISMYQTIP